MKRFYTYCFDYPVRNKNGLGLKIERKFGYKELNPKGQSFLLYDDFWNCFKKTISTEEKDLLYCKENNLGIHVIWLECFDDEDKAKDELNKLLKKFNGNKKQVSSENRKCRLELDEDIKKFLLDKHEAATFCLGYLFILFVLALLGVCTGSWWILFLFSIPALIIVAVGVVVLILALTWEVGEWMRNILYRKLGIETEANDD